MGAFVIADLYGLAGFALAPGMLTLPKKIERAGNNFIVLGPYNRDDSQQAAADLAMSVQHGGMVPAAQKGANIGQRERSILAQ